MYQRTAKATLSIKHQMRQMSMSNLTRTRIHVLTNPGQPIGDPKLIVSRMSCKIEKDFCLVQNLAGTDFEQIMKIKAKNAKMLKMY